MLKEEVSPGEWTRWCDSCRSAVSSVYCRADSAYLCTRCDADVHSANPLALRHHRFPILPNSPSQLRGPTRGEEEEEEVASWLLVNPVRGSYESSNGFLFGGEVEEYLDLGEFSSCGEKHNKMEKNHGEGSEVVVPLQMEMECEVLKAGFNYTPPMSQSISLSSMEASMTEISNSHIQTSKGSVDLFSGPPLQMPLQFTPMDREARVLRYREKKKARKFEKTIRYESRKAYAETRPRIKGRFAKRSDVELQVDQMFSTSVIDETSYGIVPSFQCL